MPASRRYFRDVNRFRRLLLNFDVLKVCSRTHDNFGNRVHEYVIFPPVGNVW